MAIDDFFDLDSEYREIEQTIANIDERKEGKIDWTKAWGKRYPVLLYRMVTSGSYSQAGARRNGPS